MKNNKNSNLYLNTKTKQKIINLILAAVPAQELEKIWVIPTQKPTENITYVFFETTKNLESPDSKLTPTVQDMLYKHFHKDRDSARRISSLISVERILHTEKEPECAPDWSKDQGPQTQAQ